MLIVITGTPGTGKTSASAILGKMLGVPVLHLREFVRTKGISIGFDKNTRSEIVDLKNLGKELKTEITKRETRSLKRSVLIEGHLACEIRLPASYVFVLRCNPRELRKRLKERGYPAQKIEENLVTEMLDYCTQNAEANYPKSKIVEIETAGKNAEQTAEIMRKSLSGEKTKIKPISYQKELKKYLRLR